MEFGLLWYDDTASRSLADKVARAAAQYELKFGQTPTVCFVNPAMLNGNGKLKDELRAGAVRIETLRSVLPHHFLVGVEETRRGKRRMANGE